MFLFLLFKPFGKKAEVVEAPKRFKRPGPWLLAKHFLELQMSSKCLHLSNEPKHGFPEEAADEMKK